MLGRAVHTALAQRADVDVDAPRRTELDLMDAAAVREYVDRGAFDIVVHAAAKVGGIGANIADPAGFLLDNTAINTSVLGAALGCGVPRLLNIGSSCMYPRDFRQPLRVDDLMQGPLEPTNEGYALAKLMAERFCNYASAEHGVIYRTVIPSNLYGPFDHFEAERAHLVAAAIAKVHRALADGSDSVEVWGDGTARREFTYVHDVSSWIADVIDRLDLLPVTMNVGYGTDLSVREYYETVAEVLGFTGRLAFDTSKPAGMRQKLMDSSVAREHGWAPSTDLRHGIEATYAFFQTHVEPRGSAVSGVAG
jgi:GDP-L-fucose synthase